ncbi:MAG: hypothetical protein HY078_17340 [Elusimicrobia bacterium]|nr:hypothetical protein [Elusimicrobiota bacterium]
MIATILGTALALVPLRGAQAAPSGNGICPTTTGCPQVPRWSPHPVDERSRSFEIIRRAKEQVEVREGIRFGLPGHVSLVEARNVMMPLYGLAGVYLPDGTLVGNVHTGELGVGVDHPAEFGASLRRAVLEVLASGPRIRLGDGTPSDALRVLQGMRSAAVRFEGGRSGHGELRSVFQVGGSRDPLSLPVPPGSVKIDYSSGPDGRHSVRVEIDHGRAAPPEVVTFSKKDEPGVRRQGQAP